MKKNLAAFLLLLGFVSTGYAAQSFPQHVKVCVNVLDVYKKSNVLAPMARNMFSAEFKSSDTFDPRRVAKTSYGRACAEHTYKHGPKTLTVGAGLYEKIDVNSKFYTELDSSCSYMERSGYNQFRTKVNTSQQNEYWEFTFKPAKQQHVGYVYSYNLTCRH